MPEDLALTPADTSDNASNDQEPLDPFVQAPPADTDPVEPEDTVPRPLPVKRPSTARERLEAAGVVFNDTDSVEGLPQHKTLTYYIVTLSWLAHPL